MCKRVVAQLRRHGHVVAYSVWHYTHRKLVQNEKKQTENTTMQPVALPSPVKIVRNNEEGDKEKEDRKMKINREMDEMKRKKGQQETDPHKEQKVPSI